MGFDARIYWLGSAVTAVATVSNAYRTREQFYSVCLYLVQSKFAMMVLGNLAFATFVLFGTLVKAIFFGKLRNVEAEHLTEKVWSTMMDTLLIMTIFRDEFDARFISLFVFLLFIKILHWLSHDRVDFLQQTPEVSRSTHIRLFTLMCLLLIIDVRFVNYAVNYTLQLREPSFMILFGFEYLLLLFNICGIMIKYFMNVYDMRLEGRWENKGGYILYLDFIIDFFKLLVYLAFFGIILTYYGIPLHIIRQLYVTFVSFRRRAIEVNRYRKATTNMNQRFPNATPQELAESQTCIVCREDMTEGKKLPCGHILHLHCLRSWLERAQVCPICRMPVLQEEIGGRPAAPGAPAPGPANAPVGQNPAIFQNLPNPQFNFQPVQVPVVNLPNIPRGNNRNNNDGNQQPLEQVLQQIAVSHQQIFLMNQQLQQQIGVLNEQFITLQHILAQNAHQQPTPPTNPNPPPPQTPPQNSPPPPPSSSPQHMEDNQEDEEELIKQALRMSSNEYREQLTKSQSSPPSSPIQGREGKEELTNEDNPDEIRRKRLLRFSQNDNK